MRQTQRLHGLAHALGQGQGIAAGMGLGFMFQNRGELFALEDATLELKRTHGINLDRGRLVRTAVALALADLAEHGPESVVVGELRAQ